MKQKNVCKFNKYGYCKYGDKCHFRHNNVMCVDKNCEVFDCEKRHPKLCKYFRDFKKCRFTTCAFKHDNQNDVNEDTVEKVKRLEKRLYEIECASKKNEQKGNEKNVEKKLEVFEKNYVGKIETLENQLRKFNKIIDEKDFIISSLEKRFEEIQNKFAKQETEIDTLKAKRITKEESKKPEENLQCPDCDFKSNSKQGLKVHMKRKHTSYTEENQPSKCEICDEEFSWNGKPLSNEEIVKHMISHSYKCSSKLKYKCDECEFWGPTTLTMEVHVKKKHSEKITCGLCDYEVNDIETLETHLFTCEIYACRDCKKTFKTFPDIKSHINKDHNGKNICVNHLKTRFQL